MDGPISLKDLLIAVTTEKLDVHSPISFEYLVLEQARDAFFQNNRKELEDDKPINFRQNCKLVS